MYNAPGGGGGASGHAQYGNNGGCGGGAGGYSYSGGNISGGSTVNSTVVNLSGSIITSGPTNTSSYAIFGNNGSRWDPYENYYAPGGGGGIGSMGVSPIANAGNGLYKATIGEKEYNFREYFANGSTSFGVNDGNGNYYIGGGGSGGGGVGPVFSGSGGLGGGGNARTPWSSATAGYPNTGGGGGTGAYRYGGNSSGGSGIVIIRYRSIQASSSIELIRGTNSDINIDYNIGNYNGEFIIKSSITDSNNNLSRDNIKITGSTGAITNPTGTTSWTPASDKRIKENIERASYDKCYENINNLELNRFNYINGFNTVNRDITQLGFIAQEVKEIFPKAIFIQEYHNDILNIPDLHSIDVTQINYSLYGAVKKLIEINNSNKEKIKRIENILNIDIDNTSTSNLNIDTLTKRD
jgi:hypothetical protein